MKISVNEQIHLSEILQSDQAACVQHLNEKAIYERTLRIPYPYKETDFQKWLKIVKETTQRHGRPVDWAIRDKDNWLIGGCGFQELQIGKSHKAEIGYWLAKPYWGQGIMTAVVERICKIGFEEFGLIKILAHVFVDNIASAAVLQKCGFQQEGYLRKHCMKDGNYLDARLLARLNES